MSKSLNFNAHLSKWPSENEGPTQARKVPIISYQIADLNHTKHVHCTSYAAGILHSQLTLEKDLLKNMADFWFVMLSQWYDVNLQKLTANKNQSNCRKPAGAITTFKNEKSQIKCIALDRKKKKIAKRKLYAFNFL